MIELTLHNGRRVSINPMLVTHVEALETGARLHVAGGNPVQVVEEYAAVVQRMKAWTKG